MKEIGIGLAGFGTVGSAVYQRLTQENNLLFERSGIRLKIVAISVRNPSPKRKRKISIPKSLLVQKADDLVSHPKTDIIVEVMGGYDSAQKLILSSLKAKKPVVTANKALLAEYGNQIFQASHLTGTPIYSEASVAGGIPIIKSLREGLIANQFHLIYGIVNGTCNYILSKMSQENADFHEVLGEAQAKGFAEADPSFDIDGLDAAHKATILASLAYGGCVDFKKIYIEGIRNVSKVDVQFSHQLGYEIKLLAIIRTREKKQVEIRVHPTLIPKTNHLSSIHGVTNAIIVRGHVVGDIEFSGPGAGGNANASAILSDISQASIDLLNSHKFPHTPLTSKWLCSESPKVLPIDEVISRYYLRLSVSDRPGVMAQISSILGQNHIGISSIIQPEGHGGKYVPLIFMIHDAKYKTIQQAVRKIRTLDCVKSKPILFRVETFDV